MLITELAAHLCARVLLTADIAELEVAIRAVDVVAAVVVVVCYGAGAFGAWLGDALYDGSGGGVQALAPLPPIILAGLIEVPRHLASPTERSVTRRADHTM